MKYSANQYTEAVDFMEQSYRSYSEVFEDYHGVISPCSTGVADKGLKSTGSPEFCTVWTYMGLPSISLPLLTGENNLPLGVQLVGDKLDDLRFLGTANWLEKTVRTNEQNNNDRRVWYSNSFFSWLSNNTNSFFYDRYLRMFYQFIF